MISFDQKKICLRAVDHYGVEHQKRKAIEELGELICELSREQDKRTDREHILEELADVIIMCEQLRLIYGGEETDKWIDRKLKRLRDMMRLPKRRV
jgi:NTP pyrophosphatase (non-canonical NTP hydrolase)